MEKNKKSILNYIFFIILINMIPSALLGMNFVSDRIYTILYALVYLIQLILMLHYFLINKIKFSSTELILLLIFFTLKILSFFYNLGKYYYLNPGEIIVIFSFVLNILFFIIGVKNIKVKKTEWLNFMKKMVLLGLFAMVVNFILNFKNINLLRNLHSSYELDFKSFFPNRNQYGMFLVIITICNEYLILNQPKNKKYKYMRLFILINLLLTFSRTSILGEVVFYISYIVKKIKNKNFRLNTYKFVLLVISLFIILGVITIIYRSDKIQDFLGTALLRVDSIKTGTGRFKLWSNGINIAINNNILFGIGRYQGIKLNNIMNIIEDRYFHSLYIETLVSFGIIGLISLILFLVKIYKDVSKYSDEKYSLITSSSIIAFIVISIFESTTRFSIGYADTMGLIFYFSIPIIMINFFKEKSR